MNQYKRTAENPNQDPSACTQGICRYIQFQTEYLGLPKAEGSCVCIYMRINIFHIFITVMTEWKCSSTLQSWPCNKQFSKNNEQMTPLKDNVLSSTA